MAASRSGAGVATEDARRRAEIALLARLRSQDEQEPFAAAVANWAIDSGRQAPWLDALLSDWSRRQPGSPVGLHRHRWSLPRIHRADLLPAWRPAEHELRERDAQAFADRLLAPLVTSEAARLLTRLAAGATGAERDLAESLLRDEQAVIDDELARSVQAVDTWADSFALWCFSRDPALVERFNPLLIAIAARLASGARRVDGLVRGRRYPWYAVALVSASAHLASALLALGIYPSLLPHLVEFVGRQRRADGGWGDEGQASDVLTSLVAADLLSRLDPGFDPAPTVTFLAGQQAGDGTWAAAGPDASWLTAAVAGWLADAQLPFADRYRWPTVLPWSRDRRCGIPGYGHFSDLADMLARLPALCDERVDLAFIDLAGFGAWNTSHGQAAGDAVLAAFAAACDEVPAARAMRDGGDEFLLLGAPRRAALHDDLERLLVAWPNRWRATFGDVPVVAPRVVLARAPARDLLATRERLGLAIGQLKAVTQDVPASGVLVALEEARA